MAKVNAIQYGRYFTAIAGLRAAGVERITLRMDKGFFSKEMVLTLQRLEVDYVLKVPAYKPRTPAPKNGFLVHTVELNVTALSITQVKDFLAEAFELAMAVFQLVCAQFFKLICIEQVIFLGRGDVHQSHTCFHARLERNVLI